MTIADQSAYWSRRAIASGASTESSLWQGRRVWNWHVDRLQKFKMRRIINGVNHHHRVLDVGCGVGRMAPVFASRAGSYFGIDASREAILVAQKRNISNAWFRTMNATRLDCKDCTFDWVFSITALECITDPAEFCIAVKEIKRVLKPGGRFVFLEQINDKTNAPNLLHMSREEFVTAVNGKHAEAVDIWPIRWLYEMANAVIKHPDLLAVLMMPLLALEYLPHGKGWSRYTLVTGGKE